MLVVKLLRVLWAVRHFYLVNHKKCSRRKFLINNYMEDFEYYGLFLTEGSKTKLKEWLWLHGYDFNNDIIKGLLPNNWYLDHCTLLHRSQRTSNSLLEETLGTTLVLHGNLNQPLEINGIGVSDKALAFRCNIPENLCANKVPHITICTFNGGKPVDSNMITEWKDIESIFIETKLKMKKKR